MRILFLLIKVFAYNLIKNMQPDIEPV